MSDLSGDDDLFETMSQELLWAQGEDVASAMTFPVWTALSSGKTSPCVEPHSTVNETLSKVASSLQTLAGSMVSKSLNSCVPPGMGKNRSLPKRARLRRMLNKHVARVWFEVPLCSPGHNASD